MTDERDALSALIDREPVDPEVLARVLEDPASRRLLVDLIRLRHAVQRDDIGDESPRPMVQPGATPRSRAAWARIAAAVLLLAAGVGSGVWAERYASRERPPEPARVVQLEPAPPRQ